ncbi:MAG: outer membrane protein [Porticoccaceae bacterium]|jgi:outer membrane protein
MFRIFRYALALPLMLAISTLQAENLLDTLDKALISDPTFLGASYQRDALSERLIQARSSLLPRLSMSYEDKETGQNIKKSDNNVFGSGSSTFGTTTSTLTLSQSIFDYEYWMRYNKAKITTKRSVDEFEQARQNLMLRVSQAYFEQIKAREQLAAIGSEKEALYGHLNYAQKSVKAGIGRMTEVDDADARYLASVAREVEYQKLFDDARYNLMEITGSLSGPLAAIKEDAPLTMPSPASPKDWITRGIKNNPDVAVAEKILEEARYEIKALKSGHYPTLQLEYNAYDQDTGGSLFGGGSRVKTEDIILRLEIPLYEGGVVSSRSKEAVQMMYKAQEDVHFIKRAVKNEVQSSFHGLVANIAQTKALKRALTAQENVLKSKRKGLQSGLYKMMAVLDAEQDLARARQAYIAVRNDYAINYVRLKRATGLLVADDITTVNGWLINTVNGWLEPSVNFTNDALPY